MNRWTKVFYNQTVIITVFTWKIENQILCLDVYTVRNASNLAIIYLL